MNQMGFLCIIAVGVLVWFAVLTISGVVHAFSVTLVLMPLVMWLAIRMLEDGTAALRAAKQLGLILRTTPSEWEELQQHRKMLVEKLLGVATPAVSEHAEW